MSNPLQPMPGQQVIHVAQDSDTDLEALFNSVMNPKPSSWRKKMLPESFFKEPDSGSHSRQSSTDSGSHPPRLTVQHVRSHSSPASLQLGLGANPTPSPVHHSHIRHQSFDVAEELPLPPGWEMAYTSTGQKYFLNHVEKITTWHDPRKTMTAAMNQMSLHAPPPSATPQQRNMALSQPNLGELPDGWEQAENPSGETYFIDHKTQRTSWIDPRVDARLMMSQHHHQQQLQHTQQQQPQQAQALGSPGSLPQQQSSQAGMMSLSSPLGVGVSSQHQQKMRLQRIQLERERIQRRQEELMRQVALCRQLPMDSESMAPVPTPGGNPAQPMTQGNMPTNGADPFLNSGHFQHSREQSTDSGLGLGCYSIPTTPEDFLNNMEEMDTGESMAQAGNMNVPQHSRFPDFLDSLPGTNVDLGTLEGADLIPILNDVESVLNKSEPFLTWL
ncbi:WW domain-containing transcription regulator protein 1 isoform X2 [Salmo salar]|uniref:WW domain-containing transcription regulator protein 1 isoform X2 n=1 Tax=Salmo salar TaxID=8030 RepID=A0A1S3P931_SALSA|nr:WW domain-containing transcription regulator protein 1-like isoform X2 [Salmo salar]|eukprot:XP_014024140.1 PREDICTED: WW domain-containing transcription regulator protein 1-like isoform X2 [Salmo salar]